MTQSTNPTTVPTVEALLVQSRAQIIKYLPRHLDADKMIYVALETVRADSFLRQASRSASSRRCSRRPSLA